MEKSITRVKGHNSRMRWKTKISIINKFYLYTT